MSVVNIRYCSFCGRNEHEVHVIIVGWELSMICDICIGHCNEIILEQAIKKAT